MIGTEGKINLETDSQDENTLSFIAPIFLASTGKLAVNSKPYFANGKVNHYLTTLYAYVLMFYSHLDVLLALKPINYNFYDLTVKDSKYKFQATV